MHSSSMSPQAFLRRSLDTTSFTVVFYLFFIVNPSLVICHEKCLEPTDVTGFFLSIVHRFDVNCQTLFLSENFSTLRAVKADIEVERVVVDLQVSKGGLSRRTFITLKPLGLS